MPVEVLPAGRGARRLVALFESSCLLQMHSRSSTNRNCVLHCVPPCSCRRCGNCCTCRSWDRRILTTRSNHSTASSIWSSCSCMSGFSFARLQRTSPFECSQWLLWISFAPFWGSQRISGTFVFLLYVAPADLVAALLWCYGVFQNPKLPEEGDFRLSRTSRFQP